MERETGWEEKNMELSWFFESTADFII